MPVRPCSPPPEGLATDESSEGGASETKRTTSEGFEVSYVSNHLSHLVLSLSLLPCFPADGSGRIVNVSSQLMYYSNPLEPGLSHSNSEDVLGPVEEGELIGAAMFVMYNRTKAMQTVGTVELQTRAKGRVIVNAIHPGRSRSLSSRVGTS